MFKLNMDILVVETTDALTKLRQIRNLPRYFLLVFSMYCANILAPVLSKIFVLVLIIISYTLQGQIKVYQF